MHTYLWSGSKFNDFTVPRDKLELGLTTMKKNEWQQQDEGLDMYTTTNKVLSHAAPFLLGPGSSCHTIIELDLLSNQTESMPECKRMFGVEGVPSIVVDRQWTVLYHVHIMFTHLATPDVVSVRLPSSGIPVHCCRQLFKEGYNQACG